MNRAKMPVKDLDPCYKERQLFYKCLDENGYDHEKCKPYNENGKVCKMFWHEVMMERRKNRIYPDLPIGEEREKIRQEFLKKFKKPVI